MHNHAGKCSAEDDHAFDSGDCRAGDDNLYRGKRQIENEEELKGLIEEILKTHKVEGLLGAEYEKEVEWQEKYEGKGGGAKHRKKKIVERIRYQIVNIRSGNQNSENRGGDHG